MAKSTTPAKSAGKGKKGEVARYQFPGDMFADMQSRLNSVFDDFWRDWPAPAMAKVTATTPKVDVEEHDKGYLITAELPGMDEKDVEVTVADDMLTLKGEKKQESERDENNMHISERSYGSFRRSFRLPPEVAADKISADFDKGVLKISVPKVAEKASPVKKINIKKGG